MFELQNRACSFIIIFPEQPVKAFGTFGSYLRTTLNISVCQFNFQHGRQNTQIDFELAQERTHKGDKPFSCSHSSTSGNLKRHERVHTIEKRFSCSQCDFKCSMSSHLKRRERTHTGDKPFSCSQCDKNGQPQANLIDKKEPRAVINHSFAPCVTTNVYYQTIDIKEPTLVILTWWKKFQE